MSGIKRTKFDAIFSDLVRERVDFACERCGHYEPPGPGRQRIHCSHFKSRGNHAVRYEPLNAVCLCASCHKMMGENPDEHFNLYIKIFGAGSHQVLTQKANRIMRRRKADLEAMHKHYKAELARLKGLRAEGRQGRIDFEAFD